MKTKGCTPRIRVSVRNCVGTDLASYRGMKTTSARTAVLTLVLFSLTQLHAKEAVPVMPEDGGNLQPRKLPAAVLRHKKLMAARTTSSTEAPAQITEKATRASSPSAKNAKFMSIGIGVGYGGASSSVQKDAGSALTAGMTLDAHGEYFGFEAEGFFSPASSPTTSGTTQTKLQNWGAMGILSARLPMRYKRANWIPRLGVGYGMFNVDQETTENSRTDKASSTMSGLAGRIGFDVEPNRSIKISIDYTRSFGASGTQTTELAEGITSSSEMSDPAFDQLRIGAKLLVSSDIGFGLQYQRRGWGLANTIYTSAFLGYLFLEL